MKYIGQVLKRPNESINEKNDIAVFLHSELVSNITLYLNLKIALMFVFGLIELKIQKSFKKRRFNYSVPRTIGLLCFLCQVQVYALFLYLYDFLNG